MNEPKYLKSNLDKLAEFFHGTRIILDLRKMIFEGKYYQITPIYGQLRALITDKTKERNNEDKPLFEISKLLGEDEINVFIFPDTLKNELPTPECIELYVNLAQVTINRIKEEQIEISLQEFLEKDIIYYKQTNKLKVHEIITLLSNKYGGSHYDSKVPQYLNDLMKFGGNYQNPLDSVIFQITDLFTQLAIKFVKKITDFELFLTICLDKVSYEQNFIFDYAHPNSNCRFSMFTKDGYLWFYVVDHFGRFDFFQVLKIIKTNELILISLSHRLNNEFKSIFEVSIDGINVYSKAQNEPFLMINEISAFKSYLNNSIENKPQDFEFGFDQVVMYGRYLDDYERAKIYLIFSKRETKSIIFFKKFSYGIKNPGSKDLETVGEVIIQDIEEI